MNRRQFLCRTLVLLSLHRSDPALAQARALMLAQVYRAGMPLDLSRWWISEKYDGIRAYWDGRQLWSRSGTALQAPTWFTQGLPARALDGELWAGRGQFELSSSIVRNASDDDGRWQRLRYLIFDLPDQPGDFDQRLTRLRQLPLPPQAQAVAQFKLATVEQLHTKLHDVVSAGGEGLVLHRGDSAYVGERSDALLKFKPYDDAEAIVLAYVPGKGRLQGLMGALEVQGEDGRRFRIGGGFSDEQRRHPPAIGSRISYAYNGLTAKGLPRFARFLRIREDTP